MNRDPLADYAYMSPEQVARTRPARKNHIHLHVVVLAAIVLTCLILALRAL